MPYSLISAQSYVVPPAALWQDRLPAALKEAAPRPTQSGTHWLVGPPDAPMEVAVSIADCGAAEPPGVLPTREALPFDQIPAAAWDAAARLEAQDRDGVDAETLYCLPQIMAAIHCLDRDHQVACVDVYNQWLTELCAAAPNRLIGLAQLPATGVDDASSALEQWVGAGKLRGAQLRAFPNASAAAKPEDDPFWQRAIELGAVLAVDRKLGDLSPEPEPLLTGALYATPAIAAQLQTMLYAGTLDRHPDLRLIIAGPDAGWVPAWYEATDNNYMRTVNLRSYRLADPDAMPSDYFRRHFHYMAGSDDSVAVRFHGYVGTGALMWCNRFPRSEGNWPNDRLWAERWTRGLPGEVKHALLAGNAVRIHRLPGHEDVATPATDPVRLPHLLSA